MDITVRITKRADNSSKSHTFIGDKKDILPDIRALIQKNKKEAIVVISEDGNKDLTFKELFEEDKWWDRIPHGPSMGD